MQIWFLFYFFDSTHYNSEAICGVYYYSWFYLYINAVSKLFIFPFFLFLFFFYAFLSGDDDNPSGGGGGGDSYIRGDRDAVSEGMLMEQTIRENMSKNRPKIPGKCRQYNQYDRVK